MLSRYRVFSRRFVKSLPALSREFGIQTELTVHAMSLRIPQTERQVGFCDRPTASESKLRTYQHGLRILSLIIRLIRHERPMLFYGIIVVIGVLSGFPVIIDFLSTGLVTKPPRAILAVGIVITAILTLMIDLALDGVLKSRQDSNRLNYLLHSAGREDPPS